MNYQPQRCAAIAVGTLIVGISGSVIIGMLLRYVGPLSDVKYVFILAASAGVVAVIFTLRELQQITAIERKSTMTFEWYKTTSPASVTRVGVICSKCGGDRVHVRNLMGHTYLREHFCVRCGHTLYYSSES
jgi:ribosomal protein S27AE